MGERLNVSDSSARRRRRRLDKAGLIEVLGTATMTRGGQMR
jgi:Mn-dependent DtxR family transcriptional regulator